MPRKIDWDSQVGRRLKLRDLHLFSAVVQCRSMAKAAAHLGISQPAVSEVIADLERTLGVRLFDRSSQGVQPTMYGQALLKRSVAAFDELKQGIRDIEFLSDPTSGELRIGCGMALSATILPPIIHQFSQKYPRVAVQVSEVPAPAQELSGLRARSYDLILGRWRMPFVRDSVEDELNVEVLFDDPLVVAAGPKNRWTSRRKIDLAELVDEPWIMTPPPIWNYTEMAEIFRTRGLPMPRINLMTASVPLRTYLLANGAFVTAVPKSLADCYSLKILPIVLPARHWPVVIVTLKNRTLSPVVERFIVQVRETTKSMRERRRKSGKQ
jgi:DNA-binding transcriptional LysR family regulator